MKEPTENSKAKNSRLLIERFSQRIDGFNVRQQTLEDLYRLCAAIGVTVVELPFRRLHGGAFEDRGEKYLYVNELLPCSERTMTGFHELTHISDHVLEVEPFRSTGNLWNVSKFERQANIIGALAWMPDPLIRGLSIEQIVTEFGVSKNVAEFRLSLKI